MHYHKSQHPIALNIKQILKEKDPATKKEQQAVTKLAIGKPGGIDADTDDYDTVVALVCVACNIELERTEPQIASLIDSILLTQSAYYVNTVEEWELKIDPCEHTLTLNQDTSSKIAEKAMAHCEDCDLKANLWLCMTCGHLGCGRKYYDGSGGNNHASEHFDAHKSHAVVCKLGTITPEGTACKQHDILIECFLFSTVLLCV